MDVAVREKLNSGYITRTYDTFKKGVSRSVQKVRAFLASMTRAGGGTVRIGYKKLSEKLKKAFKILVITAFAVASLSFAFMNLTVTAALISLMLASAWLGAQLIYKA